MLVVLDVGGGVFLFLVLYVIDVFIMDLCFFKIRKVLKNFGNFMMKWVKNLVKLMDSIIRLRFVILKVDIIGIFEIEVVNLFREYVVLKYICKVKKWLKVGIFGKVLGLLFDVVIVGVNVWVL